jgi:hypothetical protein
LINTHLESCKENQGVRQAQLVECFKKMNAYIARDSPDNEGLTIFAGDLNVRDPEVIFIF